MKLTILLALIAASAAAADTLILKDGRTLTNAKAAAMTGAGITIEHSGGTETVTASNLPDGYYAKAFAAVKAQEKAAAAAKAEKEKAAAAAAEAERKRQETARQPPAKTGAMLKVKSVHGGGTWFRYYFTLTNHDGDAAGLLSVRYESDWKPEGVGSQTISARTKKGTETELFIDWHTGPPVRHGEAGLKRLVWVYQCTNGERYEGSAAVPDEVAGALAPDAKMVMQRDKMPPAP